MVKRIFRSCHFGPSDHRLIQRMDQFVASHNLRAVMDDVLGGGGLNAEVMNKIENESDALIASFSQCCKMLTDGLLSASSVVLPPSENAAGFSGTRSDSPLI